MKRTNYGKKKSPMNTPRRASLFWDVDPKKIDPIRHPRYVIERILDFGLDPEVRWMVGFFSKKKIAETLHHSRVLQPKTRALWETLLSKR